MKTPLKKSIKISNSCSEKWENMQDSSQGKFCEICSKCVVDFTDKTDKQIQDAINNASDREICGRITKRSLSGVAAGIVLIANLSFVQAQTNIDYTAETEQKETNPVKLSGRLFFRETKKIISGAEIFFINKSKLIKTTTNENGYFFMEIPDDMINNENVLYFNFDKINEEKALQNTGSRYSYENQTIIFSRKEKIENKEFLIGDAVTEIGAVVIVTPTPPNYYYFNGKNITERKFKKIRQENSQYRHFYFDGKEAEIIAGDDFVDRVYLLYSN